MRIISAFLQERGIVIPDNRTPETPIAVKVKQMLIDEFALNTDVVVNEASLQRDLDLYDLERIDFLVTWMAAFDIDYTQLKDVVGLEGKCLEVMMYVGTVGEIIALTEWLIKHNH